MLQHGTFLGQRWEADNDGVNLYHCADEGRGFFVEVGVDYAFMSDTPKTTPANVIEMLVHCANRNDMGAFY